MVAIYRSQAVIPHRRNGEPISIANEPKAPYNRYTIISEQSETSYFF